MRSFVVGLALLLAPALGHAQIPTAARGVEPVILTGKQIADWTRSAATVVCTPAGGISGTQDAHHGTTTVPPDVRTGVPVDQVVAYRWDGAWTEIPVQVDEMYPYCLANPHSNPGVGFGAYSGTDKELTYAWSVEAWKMIDGTCSKAYPASPPTMTGPTPDPVPTLDDDDEVVFMASDAGQQAPLGTLPPANTTVASGQAVAITDPLDPTTTRFVYLYLWPGGSSFNTTNGYVSYVRDANADEWIDQCSFVDASPEKLGSSNTTYGPNLSGTVCRTVNEPGRCPSVADGTPRPSTDRFARDGVTVTTQTYEWHASGRWMVRSMRVAKPTMPFVFGPDLIDRWKGRAFQQSPDSTISLVGFEDEQVNWEGNNILLGERAGPVRAIREIWGADSGTNVTKLESFYRDAITYHYHVRVHPIPPDGLYTSWDYNKGIVTKYYNRIKPNGVDIDGVNDDTGNVDGVFGTPAYFDAPDPTFNVPSALLNWEEVSGKDDNGSLVYIQELKGATTAENPAVVPYYRDDSCLDDGTGDNPVGRPWPGEASDDTRVLNGYCAANGKPNGCHVCRTAADPGPCDVDCKLGQTQGVYAAHGTHYFFSNDTDNLQSPEALTEIDAQQWQFAVPTAATTNIGEPYGNTVIAPLQKAVVRLVALPLPTTTTTTSTTTTTGSGTTSTTAPGATTTTTSSSSTTTLTLPNPTPPSAADVSAVTDENAQVDVTLSGADLTDCELSFTIVTPPAHGSAGSLTSNPCSLGLPSRDTASVPYQPAAGFHGTDSFTYVVNDGTSNSAPATVTVTVKSQTPPLCANGPITGCRHPLRAQASSIRETNRTPDTRDRLMWKWTYGDTPRNAFGNPATGSTNYQLCVYDAAGNTIGRASAPPGPAVCKGRPCWRDNGTNISYRSRSVRLSLRPGANGKAKIALAGRGAILDLSPLPATQPVTVQIKTNENQCWEAIFNAPAQRNEASRFQDKGE